MTKRINRTLHDESHHLALDDEYHQRRQSITHAKASWRNGALSDWTVVVGNGEQSRQFAVHRYVLGLGDRSSTFFFNQLNNPVMGGLGQRTHLEIGRAMLCHCPTTDCSCPDSIVQAIATVDALVTKHFPIVLEYMYEGAFDPTEESVVALLVLADFLQIDSLSKRLDAFFATMLTSDNVLRILRLCMTMNFRQELIVPKCIDIMARNFASLSYEQLCVLSPEVISTILTHPALAVTDGIVGTFLARFIRENNLANPQMTRILSFLNENRFDITGVDALYFLEQITMLLRLDPENDVLRSVRARCFDSIAANFDLLPGNAFAELSVDTAEGILDQDNLQVACEDDVFARIESYIAITGVNAADARRLWKTCRFSFLSAETLWRANCNDKVPKDLISSGAIMAKVVSDRQTLAQANVSEAFGRRLQPRCLPGFSNCSDCIEMSNRGRTVRQLKLVGHVTSFTRHVVNCASTSAREFHWEFKIDDHGLRNVQGIYVGIAVADRAATTMQLGCTSMPSWAMQLSSGKKLHQGRSHAYGKSFARGDTIGVSLTVQNGSGVLSFTRNGVKYGMAFEGIRDKVVPAVTVYRRSQQISLISSTIRSV